MANGDKNGTDLGSTIVDLANMNTQKAGSISTSPTTISGVTGTGSFFDELPFTGEQLAGASTSIAANQDFGDTDFQSFDPTVGEYFDNLVIDPAKRFGGAVSNYFENLFNPINVGISQEDYNAYTEQVMAAVEKGDVTPAEAAEGLQIVGGQIGNEEGGPGLFEPGGLGQTALGFAKTGLAIQQALSTREATKIARQQLREMKRTSRFNRLAATEDVNRQIDQYNRARANEGSGFRLRSFNP
jgi:hypothetical protein